MHGMDRRDPSARGHARGLLLALVLPLLCAASGCGLFGAKEEIGFRTYKLEGVGYDEATSIVYGMPREAVLLGAAARVLPLAEIGPALGALSPLLQRADSRIIIAERVSAERG